jgi:DNA-directed RNA polymerase I subunit RPA1
MRFFFIVLTRLANCYLQTICGFTLGVYDILVTKEADDYRKKMIQESTQVGDVAVAEAFSLPNADNKVELFEEFREAHASTNPLFIKLLDSSVKSRTDEIANSISKTCLPGGLLKPFPYNHLQMMIQPGAKGGLVNAMQISCLLGQIELEGKRVPRMISGKTLPSFAPYDTSPKAGGFVTGRFLTGIRPQEFFFHCMAGREGLIDTAVKTSRSGYLQRCLIKHLEGLVVNYDSTVRDSDHTVIQYLYGEDGLDILKCQMLKPKAISMIAENLEAFQMSKEELSRVKKCTKKRFIRRHNEKIATWEVANGSDRLIRKRGTAFPKFYERTWNVTPEAEKAVEETRDDVIKRIFTSWFEMDLEDRHKLNCYCSGCPDPVTFQVNPSRNFGVISEKMEQLMDNYISQNPKKLLINKTEPTTRHSQVKTSDFRKAFYTRYQKALCEPGEAVGLLAAQSIGEPSTQMTLNTFHFAGRGEMNVTLGIPRLREILMTASPNISTPSMDIPLRRDLPKGEIDNLADQVRIQLTSVTLSDVLEHVEIEDTYEVNPMRCVHNYRIRFKFLRRHYFKHKYPTTNSQVLQYFENKFIQMLSKALRRKIGILNRSTSLFDTNVSKVSRAEEPEEDEPEVNIEARSALLNRIGEDESEDSDDGDGDGDADDLKNRGVRNQELTYEEPEDEEKEHSDVDSEAEDHESGANLSKKITSNEDGEEEKEEDKDKGMRTLNLDQTPGGQYLDAHILNYRYDQEKHQWCELTLSFGLGEPRVDLATMIQEEAKKAVMHKVGKIDKAFLVKNPNATGAEYDQMIKTEGVSFLSLIKFSNIIDLNRVYSNDLHAIANTYGIEAGRCAIVHEMVNVFGMYGIEIDPRHLNLIADYMTSSGTIRGMNRQSIQTNASPVQQITFETSMNFIKTATMLGISDDIDSPSARIFVGRPVTAGSGASSCVMPSAVQTEDAQVESFDLPVEDPKKRKFLNITPSNKRTKFDE